jgi:MerR family transcriptional regulator, copper efflux regulator
MKRFPQSLNRGQIATAADVNVETIRYYERRGLIPPPRRSEANYRKYSADTIPRVKFVKHAQDLGFTLEEIRELLSLRATRGARAAEVRAKAAAKVTDIDARIAALQRMRTALTHLVAECSGDGPASGCTILHAIERGFGRSEDKKEPA